MRKRKIHNRIKTNGTNPERFDRSQLKIYAYLIPICAVMMLPIIYIMLSAFKPLEELFAYPPRFYVKNPSLDNFRMLFQVSSNTSIPASRYLFNTILVTAARMLLNAWISVSVGFVLSKKRFRGKDTLLEINNAALMFVSTAVAIPTYFVITYIGLKDNFWVNILPALAAPTGVFLTKQFIDQIPDALIEAATLDGASDYRIIGSIILPAVRPAIATVMLISFQGAWADAAASKMYLDNETYKSFAYYIETLSSGGSIAASGIAAAGTLIMFVPNIVMFIILQSGVMNTMSHSGIK